MHNELDELERLASTATKMSMTRVEKRHREAEVRRQYLASAPIVSAELMLCNLARSTCTHERPL